MRQLIISCSLSPTSRSALLANRLASALRDAGAEADLMDLRHIELPMCDAASCYEHPNVQQMQQAIGGAAAVTIATPIYNYEVGGATRNLIALTGQAWTDKIVGFLCGAGGQGSYMSVMGLADSLMLDFRSIIVPRFVYATGDAFDGDRIVDAQIEQRIEQLAGQLLRFAAALA